MNFDKFRTITELFDVLSVLLIFDLKGPLLNGIFSCLFQIIHSSYLIFGIWRDFQNFIDGGEKLPESNRNLNKLVIATM